MLKKRVCVGLVLVVLFQICLSATVPCTQRNILDIDTTAEQPEILDQTTLELTNAINAAYEKSKTERHRKKTEMEIHGTLSFRDLEVLELTAEEQKMADIKKEFDEQYEKLPKTTDFYTSNFFFFLIQNSEFYDEQWKNAVSEMQKRGVVLSMKRFFMWEDHKKVVANRLIAKYKGVISDAEINKKFSDLIATYNNIINNKNTKTVAYLTFHAACVAHFSTGDGKAYTETTRKFYTDMNRFTPVQLDNLVGYALYIQCTYIFSKQWAVKLKEELAKTAQVTDGCSDKHVCQYDCKHLTNLDCSEAKEPTTGFMDLTERIKTNGNETTAYNYVCKTSLFDAHRTTSAVDLQEQFQENVKKITGVSYEDMLKERPYVKDIMGHVDYQYLDWIQVTGKSTKDTAEIVASVINFKDGLKGFAKLCQRNPSYLKFEALALAYNSFLTDAEETAFNPPTSKIESTDPFALAIFRQRIWRSRWSLGEYTIKQYLDAYNYYEGISTLILLDFIYDLQFVTADDKRAYCSCTNFAVYYNYFTQYPAQKTSYRVDDLSFYKDYATVFATKCLSICKPKPVAQPIVKEVEKKKEELTVITKVTKNEVKQELGTNKEEKKVEEKLKEEAKPEQRVEQPKTPKPEEPKKPEELKKMEKEETKKLEKEVKKDPKLKPKPILIEKKAPKLVAKETKTVKKPTKPKVKKLTKPKTKLVKRKAPKRKAPRNRKLARKTARKASRRLTKLRLIRAFKNGLKRRRRASRKAYRKAAFRSLKKIFSRKGRKSSKKGRKGTKRFTKKQLNKAFRKGLKRKVKLSTKTVKRAIIKKLKKKFKWATLCKARKLRKLARKLRKLPKRKLVKRKAPRKRLIRAFRYGLLRKGRKCSRKHF